jgi:hypothetical protein
VFLLMTLIIEHRLVVSTFKLQAGELEAQGWASPLVVGVFGSIL